jgi:type IV pilus assembly protein PilM
MPKLALPSRSKRSKRAKTVVGLDLDPSHIAAAEVELNGSVLVRRGATAPLRPGLFRDGEAVDPGALADALRAFFAEHELPTRVRLGIANQRIVVRALDLPVTLEPKELDALVRAEAPDHIPMPMDEAVVDYQSLGVVPTAQGPRSRVVIVAVRREMVERLAHACQDAGLRLEGIDLSAFGMVRALPPTGDGAAALYVNVAGLTNVAVASTAGCLFTRAAAGGLDAIAQSLSERGALTLEHSHQWMGHVGLLAELADVQGDEAIVATTRAALEEGVHQVADTVRNSLNFYRMQEGAERVEHGRLTGPAATIPGFAERLSDLLSLPVEPALVAVDAADPSLDAGRLTVAAGLAFDEPLPTAP